MKILVINCGSSSLKYQLIDMDTKDVLAKGLAERIGIIGSKLTHKPSGKEEKVFNKVMQNHADAMRILLDALVDPECGVIKDMKEIDAVGHRVVHAGEKYASSVLITDDVVSALEECIPLAPLHNPANITGINACKEILPDVPMVGVFDTAYHQTMPPEAYIYPIPYKYYEEYGIRKYGFHGTSHKYVAMRAAKLMGRDLNELKLITCHLGNGSSISPILYGKSIDNSMGFTPMAGLAMGTRCGSIDPAIVQYIAQIEGITLEEVNYILNNESGVLGISGVSSDFRDLGVAVDQGNAKAKLALNVFTYRVVTTISKALASLNGVDGIVFTAGVGENSNTTRKLIADRLTFLGAELDPEANKIRGKEAIISTPNSKVTLMVIPTNEELMIAMDTEAIVKNLN